jgi:hypothetical protein
LAVATRTPDCAASGECRRLARGSRKSPAHEWRNRSPERRLLTSFELDIGDGGSRTLGARAFNSGSPTARVRSTHSARCRCGTGRRRGARLPRPGCRCDAQVYCPHPPGQLRWRGRYSRTYECWRERSVTTAPAAPSSSWPARGGNDARRWRVDPGDLGAVGSSGSSCPRASPRPQIRPGPRIATSWMFSRQMRLLCQ